MNVMIGWSIPDDDMPNRERLLTLALGFDWIYNGLTPGKRAPIAARLGDYVDWVADEFEGRHNWFQGHERFGMITLCFGALATVGDVSSAPDYLVQSSTPLLEHVVPIWEYFGAADGGNYYGTDYEPIVMFDMLFFFEAWRTAVGEDVAADS